MKTVTSDFLWKFKIIEDIKSGNLNSKMVQSNKKIKDPKSCNRNYGSLNYSTWCGYYIEPFRYKWEPPTKSYSYTYRPLPISVWGNLEKSSHVRIIPHGVDIISLSIRESNMEKRNKRKHIIAVSVSAFSLGMIILFIIERPLPKKGPSAFTAVIIEVFVNDLYCFPARLQFAFCSF